MTFILTTILILFLGIVTLAVWIRIKGPISDKLLRPGTEYKINGVTKKIGNFQIHNKIYLLKEDVLNDFYDLIKYTDYILQKHNIPYTVAFGTLLGAVRHGGIMPWDDDADIYVNVSNDKYDEIIYSIEEEINRDGFKIKKNYNANYFQLAKIDSKYHFPYVDWYKYWNRYGSDHYIFPIKRMPFEDFEINVPNRATDVINILYNSNGKNDPLNNIVHNVVFNRYYSLWITQLLKRRPWLHRWLEKSAKKLVKVP